IDEVVFFGLQYFVKEYLLGHWQRGFFDEPKDAVVERYARRMKNAGIQIEVDHVAALHDHGKLPVEIRALPEGARVPIGVPMFVLWNTTPEFFWLTNYLETSVSSVVWGPCTSATLAYQYRKILEASAERTGGDPAFIDWQAHDFSYRGMYGTESAMLSGAGHLLSFTGTDTVPAIDFVETYYGANSDDAIVGGSVPATEHSVMSMGTQADELETFRRLITELYPTGIVSIVSDTWDYWKVWTDYLPQLRDEILQREGTVTIRPDSGDPVKILVGDPDAEAGSPAHRGSYELAWEAFGGTTNAQGFRVLDPHINLIYGDSITLERCEAICRGLAEKRFVPTNVFGVGSFTYQYNTRDTFGFAMKATAGVVNGELREIFKDPVTDDGTKKSARGLVAVYAEDGTYRLKDRASWDDVKGCAFEPVFRDGELLRDEKLEAIRARLRSA
ncbi:MAG: nicotinate phosphoribosyltransferase, partial [Myxococcota bacterium]